MWEAWFGGFAQPSDYPNATPPNFNIHCILVSAIFVIPYLAFLVILPGVRHKKFDTFVLFTILMFVGASLAASLYYPDWTGGRARIISQFRAHVNERIRAVIGVRVGLQHINITLKHEKMMVPDPLTTNVDWSHLKYNEKFDISGVDSMTEAYKAAFEHGLPYPILSVLEYFSLNQDAFDWGRHYRTAGHYTHAAVVFALCCWSLAAAFLLLLPHHFGKAFVCTGLSALFSCLLYLILSPCQLRIGFVGIDGQRLHMEMTFRWAFYLVFAAGLLATITGLALIVLQNFRFYTLSTFLEASLDENVGPKRRHGQELSAKDLPSSVEMVRACRPVSAASDSKDSGKCSSGFQSSFSPSLRSRSSFESAQDSLERQPSKLTLHKSHVVSISVEDLQ